MRRAHRPFSFRERQAGADRHRQMGSALRFFLKKIAIKIKKCDHFFKNHEKKPHMDIIG